MLKAVRNFTKLQFPVATRRIYSSDATQQLTEGEQKIMSVLKSKFPKATSTQVQDISGGCGSMYEIYIESDDFKGKRMVMQHRMVTEALKEEIEHMHGLRIATGLPGDT